uniref:Uncharacterized protein n=1 Tax=Knipowitschia caucasica TaxID=637954 RepID=A0AAV2KMH4_KNICA
MEKVVAQEQLLEELQKSLVDKDQFIAKRKRKREELEEEVNTLRDCNTSLRAQMDLKDQSSLEEKTKLSNDFTLEINNLKEQLAKQQQSIQEKDKTSRELKTQLQSVNLATERPFVNTDEAEDGLTVDLLREHDYKLQIEVITFSDPSLTEERVLEDQSSVEERTTTSNGFTLKVSEIQGQMEALQQFPLEKDQTISDHLPTELPSDELEDSPKAVLQRDCIHKLEMEVNTLSDTSLTEERVLEDQSSVEERTTTSNVCTLKVESQESTDGLEDSPSVDLRRARIHKLKIVVNTLRGRNNALTAEREIMDQSYLKEKTKKKDLEEEHFYDALDFVSEDKDVETSAYRTVGKYLIRGLIVLSAVILPATGGFLLGSSLWSEDAGCHYDFGGSPVFF